MDFIRGTGLALLLAIGGLTGCAVGNAAGWSVPKRSLDDQIELIAPHVEIRLPAGAGEQVPALILFHGCGGLRQVQDDYAAAANEAGYAAIIVGSNAARGIDRFGSMSQVCTALRLWGQERAADVYAAVEIARADSRIDGGRLALVGWSHGGWTVLEALADDADGRAPQALRILGDEPPDLDGVQLAVAFYPYCGFPVRAPREGGNYRIPLGVVLAEEDVIAPARDCETHIESLAALGANTELEVWTGLSHAFDEPNPPADPRIRYDAEAAERARIWLIERLGTAL